MYRDNCRSDRCGWAGIYCHSLGENRGRWSQKWSWGSSRPSTCRAPGVVVVGGGGPDSVQDYSSTSQTGSVGVQPFALVSIDLGSDLLTRWGLSGTATFETANTAATRSSIHIQWPIEIRDVVTVIKTSIWTLRRRFALIQGVSSNFEDLLWKGLLRVTFCWI